jgi:hypothetical protein
MPRMNRLVLLLTLFLILTGSSSAQHLPYEMVVNADHHGLAHQGTFDLHPNGPIRYVWNTYKQNHERIYSTTFDSARRAHAQQLTAGVGIYYQPVFVATGERSGWVFWQAERGGVWQIVGRRLNDGFWEPIQSISPGSQNAVLPTATTFSGKVAVAWEDHSSEPQRIRVRVWGGDRWGRPGTVSGPSKTSHRPILTAGPEGELWAFWDRYDNPDYAIHGRRITPDPGSIERISPPGKSSLKPTAVHGSAGGLVVAWVANIDVIGGEGAIDQWNTLQAARLNDGRWQVLQRGGSADLANLSHGLLFPMEPEPGIVTGYSGRRRHPMLVEDAGEVWLLWEHKMVIHRSTEPGELLGMRFDGRTWSDDVRVHSGLISYEVPTSRRADNGELTLLGMDRMHNYRTLHVDLAGAEPVRIPTSDAGWKPQKLPLRDFGPRRSIEIDGETHYLYWGDLHVHSALTQDAEGEPDELLNYARDKAKIDVMVMQENDASSWLDSGAQGSYRGGMLPESGYRMGVYLSRKYTESGEFVALPGWEWSHRTDDKRPNHRTVIFPGDETPLIRHAENAGNFDELCDLVEAAGGIMNTQHPNFMLIRRPCEGNIEAASGWEVFMDKPEKIHRDLSAGFKVGFVATSDGHRRDPGTGGGLTGIYAPELTPHAIVDAIRDRRVFATNGSRIEIDARANGVFMGQDVETTGPVDLTLNVRTPRPLVRAVLVRDGDEIITVPGAGRTSLQKTHSDTPATGFHWYYWRIEIEGTSPDYPGNLKVAEGHQAWSSPHRISVKR